MNPNKKDDASYLQTVGRALTILEMFRQQNTRLCRRLPRSWEWEKPLPIDWYIL